MCVQIIPYCVFLIVVDWHTKRIHPLFRMQCTLYHRKISSSYNYVSCSKFLECEIPRWVFGENVCKQFKKYDWTLISCSCSEEEQHCTVTAVHESSITVKCENCEQIKEFDKNQKEIYYRVTSFWDWEHMQIEPFQKKASTVVSKMSFQIYGENVD